MSQKIRIAFLIDVMDPDNFLGGAELHTFDIIDHLNGNNFKIFCISDNREYLEYIVKNSENAVETRLLRKRKKTLGDPLYFFEVVVALLVIGPHILHTQKLKSSIWGRIAGRLVRVPVIVSTVHGAPSFWKFGKIRNFLNRIANAITANFFCDMNIVLSCIERDTLIQKDLIRNSKIKIIQNGIFGIDRFKPIKTRSAEPYRLISVGRLSWEKGHIFLIRAMEIILKRFPQTTLSIVGDGVEKKKLVELTESLGISGSVHFLGFVERKNIPEVLFGHDIFILPSIWEGFPYTLIEAMASALPVVATNVGGVKELIIDHEGGILVESKDYDGIAQSIIDLLNNSGLRERFGSFNRKRVEAEFYGSKMLLSMENLYLELYMKKTGWLPL